MQGQHIPLRISAHLLGVSRHVADGEGVVDGDYAVQVLIWGGGLGGYGFREVD